MPKIKEIVKSIKNKIRMPHITLNEKVLDGIKEMGVDDEVTLIVKAKVTEVSKEKDFDFEVPNGKERPKILKVGLEVTDVKNKK